MEISPAARVVFDTAPETYVLEVAAPSRQTGSDVVAAAGSNNVVKIYTSNELRQKAQLEDFTDTVTGLQFAPDNPHVVYLSSWDGSIRSWDIRSAKTAQTYGDQGAYKYCSIGVNCSGNIIAAGTETVEKDSVIMLWDPRNAELLARFEDSHSDDITQTRFHPLNDKMLATGSTDGLLCIFKLLSMNEEGSIMSVFNSESSVSKVGFFGLNCEFIFCLTHTESFLSWNVPEGDVIASQTDMRGQLESECKVKVDYLIDCLGYGANWRDRPLTMAAGSHSGTVSLLSKSELDNFQLSDSLVSGHSSTVRCICTDTNSADGWIVTGGEDGFVCLWCPSVSDSTAIKPLPSASLKAPSSVKRKHRVEKPY